MEHNVIKCLGCRQDTTNLKYCCRKCNNIYQWKYNQHPKGIPKSEQHKLAISNCLKKKYASGELISPFKKWRIKNADIHDK